VAPVAIDHAESAPAAAPESMQSEGTEAQMQRRCQLLACQPGAQWIVMD